MSYLVDTDWLIDALAGVPTAIEPLARLSDAGLAISIITLGELFEGAYRFPDPTAQLTRFREFLADFPVMGLTESIMELFARHRATLRQQGLLIPDFDLLIAATALHYDLTLLTRNLRHFHRLPDLHLYQES
jgi:tRNA(fMet)-specific endonuclease VapC